jgi:retron-type reverse transcriptase
MIINEALNLILNAIYEPLFQDNSHGFRPNRGRKTVFKYIKQKFKKTT